MTFSARAGVTTGGIAKPTPIDRCRIALRGGQFNPGFYLSVEETAKLRAVYDNSLTTDAQKRSAAFAIWRRARLRSLGWLNGRRVLHAYRHMPERHHYGLVSDAVLEDLSEVPVLRDTVFGLMDDVHDLEHRIQILMKMGMLNGRDKALRLSEMELYFREHAMDGEREVAGALPPSAFDHAGRLAETLADPTASSPDDVARVGHARIYLLSWSRANQQTAIQFRQHSSRARIPFAPQGRLADRRRVFDNPDLIR